MNNEITIKIKDDTENNKHSVSEVGEEVKKSGTVTKVSPSEQVNDRGGIKSMALNTGDQMTGGIASRTKGMLLGAANPMGMATLALSMATKLYSDWQRRERAENERQALMIRAGGVARNNRTMNGYNNRTQLITGKIQAESRTRYRR